MLNWNSFGDVAVYFTNHETEQQNVSECSGHEGDDGASL